MAAAIIPIPAFQDNYIWLILTTEQKAWVVDPGDATPVFDELKKHHLTLDGILITHHHHDHSGGVAALLTQWPKARVVASHKSTVNGVNEPVTKSSEILCGDYSFKVLEIPGHTLDHVAFYHSDVVFCGDTLFSVGCGKVFEGTPGEMYQSLNKLRHLPDTIQIYCGHEYTLANLQFAEKVEPQNPMIQQKLQRVLLQRQNNQPTIPSLLAEEKAINPFLRCEEPSVIRAAENYAGRTLSNPIEVFTCLRAWKNVTR